MTKWIREEWVLSYGYFKTYGMSTKAINYHKHINIFSSFQKRTAQNSFNTFARKLMNYNAFFEGNYLLDGGLHRNKLFMNEMVPNDGKIMSEYAELIKNIDEIDVPLKKKDYLKLFGEKLSISIDGKNKQKNDDDKKTIEEYSKVENNLIELNNTGDMYADQEASVSYFQLTLKKYLSAVESGEYKVPLFQRKFVWSKQQIVGFLNSLLKGYPFGNITIWRDSDNLLSSRNKFVEAYTKESEIDKTKPIYWLLDGQQRTTSIVSQMVEVVGSTKHKNIIYSFDDKCFKNKEKNDVNFIYAGDLLNPEIEATAIKEKYGIDKLRTAVDIVEKFRKRLLDSKIGVTSVRDASLNTAIDIFTEMNTTGKKLSLFDIVNAKWQTKDYGLDLEKYIYDWLGDDNRFYKPDELTVTKSIYLALDKNNISSKNIMKFILPPVGKLKEKMEQIKKSLNLAHDFLVNVMKFKGELMPSSNLIKFLTYVFSTNGNKTFDNRQNNALIKYVKYVCLNNMYSSSTDQKLQNDIAMMDKIIARDFNEIDEKNIMLTATDIMKLEYNEGSSKYYFVINYLFRNAKSLENNTDIPVKASDKSSSTINIHHVVPKSIKLGDEKVVEIYGGNSVANLAPILEKENQNISNKYPIDYYNEYKTKNDELDKTLSSMYIEKNYFTEIDRFADKDFLDAFWKRRARMISDSINNSY